MTSRRPEVILFAGLPGAGKTTVARRLEREMPAVRFTLDEWMLRLYGLQFDDPEYVSRIEPCQELIWDIALQVLAVGQHVLLDWNQWSRARRSTWRAKVDTAACSTTLYWIDVPTEVAAARAGERISEFAHDVDGAGVAHLAAIFEPPEADEGIKIVRLTSVQ